MGVIDSGSGGTEEAQEVKWEAAALPNPVRSQVVEKGVFRLDFGTTALPYTFRL